MDIVILPCHSIWIPSPSGTGKDPSEWHLAPFQHAGQDWLCFRDHIAQSLAYLEQNTRSVLAISGGATKRDAGHVTEAFSYYVLAQKMAANFAALRDRIFLEEFARDSFENVLFSLCRYYEVCGRYPQGVAVVGFEFKKHRFLNCHLKALGITNVEYLGNSPISNSAQYFEDLNTSEYNHAVRHFEEDWFGLRSPLKDKKESRNPFKRHHGYARSNGLEGFFDGEYTNEERRDVFVRHTRKPTN